MQTLLAVSTFWFEQSSPAVSYLCQLHNFWNLTNWLWNLFHLGKKIIICFIMCKFNVPESPLACSVHNMDQNQLLPGNLYTMAQSQIDRLDDQIRILQNRRDMWKSARDLAHQIVVRLETEYQETGDDVVKEELDLQVDRRTQLTNRQTQVEGQIATLQEQRDILAGVQNNPVSSGNETASSASSDASSASLDPPPRQQ